MRQQSGQFQWTFIFQLIVQVLVPCYSIKTKKLTCCLWQFKIKLVYTRFGDRWRFWNRIRYWSPVQRPPLSNTQQKYSNMKNFDDNQQQSSRARKHNPHHQSYVNCCYLCNYSELYIVILCSKRSCNVRGVGWTGKHCNFNTNASNNKYTNCIVGIRAYSQWVYLLFDSNWKYFIMWIIVLWLFNEFLQCHCCVVNVCCHLLANELGKLR